MPWSLFITKSLYPLQGALHSRRLYVGATCVSYARDQTGVTEMQHLLLFNINALVIYSDFECIIKTLGRLFK